MKMNHEFYSDLIYFIPSSFFIYGFFSSNQSHLAWNLDVHFPWIELEIKLSKLNGFGKSLEFQSRIYYAWFQFVILILKFYYFKFFALFFEIFHIAESNLLSAKSSSFDIGEKIIRKNYLNWVFPDENGKFAFEMRDNHCVENFHGKEK
jgi:hypothetical protein